MLKYFTVSLLILCACSQEKEKPTTDKDPEFKSLLLPEHQDTTTVWNNFDPEYFSSLDWDDTYKKEGRKIHRISFNHLADVRITMEYEPEFALDYQKGHFGEYIKQLNGKWVEIRGFMLPLDHAQNFYVLSRNPYSSCFFCGKAGLESVARIKFREQPDGAKYRMDDVITVRGRLSLNNTRYDELAYIIDLAELVGPN